MQPNIAIISGEISGDLVGGALARELLALHPDLQLWGIGSRHMKEAGVDLLYDSSAWSAIGVVKTLQMYPKLRWSAYPHIVKEVERRKPSVVILIDFGVFNVKVAYKCKERGVPVFYYFPPGSWRRKGRVNPEIARVTDHIATPFPWSEERLKGVGANATFVGHPLLELVKPRLTRSQFAEEFGMDPGKPIIGLLPGSRGFEIQHNTPAMLGAARLISKELPDAQFIFGMASKAAAEMEKAMLEHQLNLAREWKTEAELHAYNETSRYRVFKDRFFGKPQAKMVTPEGILVSPDDFQKRLREKHESWKKTHGKLLPPIVLAHNLTYDVMAHSDVLLVCSGTATLEAAILNTPMVILYRGSWLMEIEGKIRRIRPEHFGLPNILADRRIVPELLQHEASPEALAEHALKLLRDPAAKAEMKAALQSVRASLTVSQGEEPDIGASRRAAHLALQLAGLDKNEPIP
jgi:lipid-A-disaccharide synthase